MMWPGRVYIVNKKGGRWKEAYVKLPAEAIPHLTHKQIVYVSTSSSTSRLENLLIQLFLSCFKDKRLAGLIVSDPERARIVNDIINIIENRR